MLQTETRNNTSLFETAASHEHGDYPPQTTLRETLLGASEFQGNLVLLPPGIVAVEAHSDGLREDTFSQASEIFQKADAEAGSFTLGPLQARGFAKLATGEFLSDFHEAAADQLERHADAPNLTLLYDGENIDLDGETKIPAAIIVHEKLSEDALKKLRADLPAGVPLIDGSTNELLDEVGADEREKHRRTTRRQRGMGTTALYDMMASIYTGRENDIFFDISDRFSSFFADQPIIHTSTEYASKPYDFYAERGGLWFNSGFSAPGDRKAKNREEFLNGGITPEAAAHIREAQRTAAEVDAYAEDARRNTTKAITEIRAAAQELYGASDPTQLTADQLRKVGRRVQSKLHPDRGVSNGGDQGAYKEVGSMIDDLRKSAPTPTEQTTESSRPNQNSSPDTSPEESEQASEPEAQTDPKALEA